MTRMTVGELKNLLDGLDDDIEVRFASQPSWPFEYSIEGVYVVEDPTAPVDDGDDDEDGSVELKTSIGQDDEVETVVYLAEGRQLGYLPGRAVRELGWSRD